MAFSHNIKFLTSILLVVTLHSIPCSALNCYGCLQLNETLDDDYPRCHEPIIVNSSNGDHILDESSEAVINYLIDHNPDLKMVNGSFCMEVLLNDKSTVTPDILRTVVASAPRREFLDKFGCLSDDDSKICFCEKNMCNYGTTTHINIFESEKVKKDVEELNEDEEESGDEDVDGDDDEEDDQDDEQENNVEDDEENDDEEGDQDDEQDNKVEDDEEDNVKSDDQDDEDEVEK